MKLISKILLTLFLIFSFIFALSPTAYAYYGEGDFTNNKSQYLTELAYGISDMKTEIEVYSTFRPEFKDMSIPEILRKSREFDSCAAGTLNFLEMGKTVSVDGGYKTTYKVKYDITKETYRDLKYWIEENFVPTVDGMSDYEKVKEAYNYLLTNASPSQDNGSPASCLKNGSGNMKAYAIAYGMLLNACDINCDYVYVNGYHWNIVELDGYWYNVDVYADDAYASDPYKHFLKGRSDWDGYSGKEATSHKAYNPDNPSANKLWNIVHYGILYVGWPISIVAFLIILFKRKKVK